MNRLEISKELFDEISSHLLQDAKPSESLNQIAKTSKFKNSEFGYLEKLKETPQSKTHHPEGNVWIHTMMVVDEAAKCREESKDPLVFMWAALLHDVGKPEMTKMRKGKLTAYDHDKAGALQAERILTAVELEPEFIDKVVKLVRWHMQILFAAKNMNHGDLETMKRQVDLKEIAMLGMSDRCGRLGVDRMEVHADIQKFLEKAGGGK